MSQNPPKELIMKPSEKEQEYIARMELEKKKKIKDEILKSKEGEAADERIPNYMKCPKCGHDLAEVDYKEVKIDRCPGCDGIWLDAGEISHVARLEKGGFRKLFSFLGD